MLKEGMFIQGRYEIVGKIGTGGMADVYKAKDHKLNRFVAVKVLKAEFRADKAFITKFRAEAQAAAGLAHPNIVNIYDVGEDHGMYFIVMELVEGITLKDYVAKKGRLTVREATSIAIQVSQGLEAAHNSGIIHRDVKPQNIIISTDGKVKVTDFGIARAVNNNTITTAAMGSVHYSSPEQARGGYSDAKSDIYSLGITLYEMLTGRVPFDGDSTVAIAIKHLQEEMKSPDFYVPDLPRSTVQIINKCTQKSPDRRYANMSELIRDLKESLVNPEGDFVFIPNNEGGRTVVISREELSAIKDSYNAAQAQQALQEPQGLRQTGQMGAANGQMTGNMGNVMPGAMTGGMAGVMNTPMNNGMVGQMNGMNGSMQNGMGGAMNGPIQNGMGNGPVPQDVYDPYTYGMDSRAYGKRGYDYQEDLYDGRRSFQDDDDDKSVLNPRLEKIMTAASIMIAILIACIFLGLVANALGLFKFSFPSLFGNRTSTESGAEIQKTTESTQGNTTQSVQQETQAQTSAQTTTEAVAQTEATETPATEEVNSVQLLPGQVPNVTGNTYEDAYDMLMEAGFYVQRQDDNSSTVPAGIVMEQSMMGNADIGSTVILIVSAGPESAAQNDPTAGSWACNVQLDAPTNYNGEQARLVLEQNGVSTILAEGENIKFPYDLNVQGAAGLSSGVVSLATLNAETGQYETIVTYDVPFSQVG
ncbi:MAG: protein kinase [Eubacteriales bacterium]|nr:protein kinase [Eubacteriales bacterium]